MKLATFTKDGQTKIGAVTDDAMVELGRVDPTLDISMLELLVGGDALMERARKAAAQDPHYGLSDVKLEAPVPRPGKMLAIGLNYKAHVAEAVAAGMQIPEHQLWFNKQTTCVTGPYDPIDKPIVSDALDYECEMAFVIGKRCRHVKTEEAIGVIAGYMVSNDVTVRDYQRHTPTFTIGKSFDTHGPTGPWLVTPDEVGNPENLDLKCFVNGELRQHSNTNDLLYTCADMIAYLSSAFTLEPGDIILSGTPAGAGFVFDPPKFLKVGDVVRCEIEKLGHIENKVVIEPAP